MTTRSTRTVVSTLFFTALMSGLPPMALAAQARQQPPVPRVEAVQQQPLAARLVDDQNARDTRQRLREMLDQYPPSVAQVLKLDPSLMGRNDYMAAYPTLASFLQQHPEIQRNPVFFLGEMRFETPETDKVRAYRLMEDILAGFAGLTVFACVISFLAWLLRAIIDYRYWLRSSRVQTEAHNKVFDRLTTNEDVLTYIQSPAGQKFLTSSSASFDMTPRAVSAPVSRILWSVQAGVVLALGGVGLWLARSDTFQEINQLLNVVSMLAVSLGVGFVLSALISFVLSQRLGLLNPPTRQTNA